MSVRQTFISYTCSLGSPFCPFVPHQPPPGHRHGPTHAQVLRNWKSIKLKASQLVLPFPPHFAPEGLSESVMTTKAADLRDSPWRRERTAVHRHIAEKAASNSWGSDRLRSGWPPHSADVNLKEQPFPLICSWLFGLPFISREKGPAWLASWLLEKFTYLLMFYPRSISFFKNLGKDSIPYYPSKQQTHIIIKK